MLHVPAHIILSRVRKHYDFRKYWELNAIVKTVNGDKKLADLVVGDVLIGDKGRKNTVKEVRSFLGQEYYLLVNDKYHFHNHQSVMQVGDIAIHAQDLKKGDWLLHEVGAEQVETIKRIHKPLPFVSLSLDGDHTYFMNGILVHNADRYWVRLINDTWNTTAGSKWSATSGGGSGASAPTTSDNAIFNGSSGTATVTINTGAACRNWDASAYGGTFGGSGSMTVAGSLTWGTGMTRNYTGNINLNGAGSFTLTFAGKTCGSVLTFNNSGGTWTFQDTFNSTTNVNLTTGTVDTNDQTLTFTTFASSNSSTRALDLGASVINISSAWTLTNSTNMTLTAGTSSIRLTGTAAFNGGGLTYYEVQCNGSAHTVSQNNSFTTLTRNGTAVTTGTWTFATNQTATNFNVIGNSESNRVLVQSSTQGTPATITATNVTATNANFMDITGAGASSWDLSAATGGSGDCGGNTDIIFSTPLTAYWYADTGSYSNPAKWFLASGGTGGASRIPLPQDTARVDSASITTSGRVITLDMPRIGTFDTTGATNTPAITKTAIVFCHGSWILAGVTAGDTLTFVLAGRGTYVIDTNGISMDYGVSILAINGSYTLLSAVVLGATRTFTCSGGDFDSDGFSITAGALSISGTVARTLLFRNSVITLLNTGTIVTTTTVTGLSLDFGTSEIRSTSNTAATRTIALNSLTFYKITFAGTSTSAMIFTGHGSIFNVASEDIDHVFQFTGGTTITWLGVWDIWTTGGSLITSTTTTPAVMSYVGGAIQGSGDLTIAYLTGAQEETFYAGAGSTDGGNNTFIYFTDIPSTDENVPNSMMWAGIGV
jgi:hypothetical protein